MSIYSKLSALLTAANTKTGESDTTLTDAVQTLIDGYGQGGGGDEDELIDGTLTSYTNDRVTSLGSRAFDTHQGLVSVSLPNLTTANKFEGVVRYCPNVEEIYVPKLQTINNSANNAFRNNPKLGVIALPSLSGVIGQTVFYGCTALTAVDLGESVSQAAHAQAYYNTKLTTLILRRKTGIATIAHANGLQGCPFASGGTGGTIYIPKVLYDHLGDGTNLDYKNATNWSTYDAYGTITWAKIEGSQYETHYADGTVIPT